MIHLSKTDLQGLGITMAEVVASIEHLIKVQAMGKAERTAFVFRSVAVGDLAVAALAYKKAGARTTCCNQQG